MRQTFAKHMHNFALTADIINSSLFKACRRLILDYTNRVLGIDVTHLLLDAEIEDKQGHTKKGLILFRLGDRREYRTISSHRHPQGPSTQSGYCYFNRKPLWIVGDNNDDILNETKPSYDIWIDSKSTEDNLPPYRHPTGVERNTIIRTSILIPIDEIGVMAFETHERLEPTPTAKSELVLLAMSIGLLYEKLRIHETTVGNSWTAIQGLEQLAEQGTPKLTHPRVFLASSLKADKKVINLIKKVLNDEYGAKLKLRFWEDMHDSGNISVHLLQELSKCRYGICYFSEEKPGKFKSGEPQYQDNANVVFEAGMLHGRTDGDPAFPAAWIPVRERKSPPAPFDFSSERTINVPRNDKGELKEKKFKDMLNKRLTAMLEEDQDPLCCEWTER